MSKVSAQLPRLLLAALAGLATTSFAQTSAPVTAVMASSAPVTSTDTRTPLERANDDAISRLSATVCAEPVGDRTAGELLDAVDGRGNLADALRHAQQIGGPRALGDGIVQVNLELSGDLVAAAVVQAVSQHPERSPISPQRLEGQLASWKERAFRSTGSSATIRVDAYAQAIPATRFELPLQPPAWTADPIVASASAASTGAPLRTARAAETAARSALRDKVHALPLDASHTLGNTPALAEVLDDLVDNAPVAGVDYHADGGAEVRVWLDGSRLWQALQLAK